MIEILIAAILAYYLCLHGLYALLIVLGATQLRRYQLGVTFGEYRRIAESWRRLLAPYRRTAQPEPQGSASP